MRVFGDSINSLRGAVRGDTIEYLTSNSKPISRWFEGRGKVQTEAMQSRFVCFGHTHIPERPTQGQAASLNEVTFLNTGSWVRPPTRQAQKYADIARVITKNFDKVDQYLVIAAIFLGIVSSLAFSVSTVFLWIVGGIFVSLEGLVAFGKSSYRRLPDAGVRSLAFIGTDLSGVWRATLLYWDPFNPSLSTEPTSF